MEAFTEKVVSQIPTIGVGPACLAIIVHEHAGSGRGWMPNKLAAIRLGVDRNTVTGWWDKLKDAGIDPYRGTVRMPESPPTGPMLFELSKESGKKN